MRGISCVSLHNIVLTCDLTALCSGHIWLQSAVNAAYRVRRRVKVLQHSVPEFQPALLALVFLQCFATLSHRSPHTLITRQLLAPPEIGHSIDTVVSLQWGPYLNLHSIWMQSHNWHT